MNSIYTRAGEIRRIWGNFQSSRVLISASKFKVFDYLEGWSTPSSIAKATHTDTRAMAMLLDALTGLGLLRKQGKRYRNRPLASRFLVSSSPYYQGDIIRHADILWKRWSMLDEVLKTGRPVTGERDHDAFIRGMHNLSVIRVKEVIKAIDLSGVKRALDLGGGPGTYTIELAKKGINVVLFDVPETQQIAESIIREAGRTKGNIEFIGGDFLVDDIGRDYDLIFVSQILHMLSERECTGLLRKCYTALSEKGRVVIQEFFLRENRTSPVQSALFSINMLINTEKGKAYTPGELVRCCKRAGFKRITKKIVLDNLLLTARR